MSSSVPEIVKSNLAILLVPGSFTPSHFYSNTSRALISEGYSSVQAIQLLSACPANDQRTPPASLEADAFYIREVLQAVLAQGKDVVLVMNSYGGFPGTHALAGLESRGSIRSSSGGEEAKSEPNSGAVVGLIYLSSFLPLAGDSLRSVMDEYLFEPLKSGDPGNYMYLPSESGPGIFSDWAAEGEGRSKDIEYWFGAMATHSSDSFDGKVGHNIWADGEFKGKVMYVIGESDVIVPPALAESMIEKVKGLAGDQRVVVKRVEKGGHMMHVTRPEAVVEAIEEIITSLRI